MDVQVLPVYGRYFGAECIVDCSYVFYKYYYLVILVHGNHLVPKVQSIYEGPRTHAPLVNFLLLVSDFNVTHAEWTLVKVLRGTWVGTLAPVSLFEATR